MWRAESGSIGLHLPRDLSQGVLAEFMGPYDSYPVWHFRSPLHVLKAFDDPRLAANFRRRVEHLRPLF